LTPHPDPQGWSPAAALSWAVLLPVLVLVLVLVLAAAATPARAAPAADCAALRSAYRAALPDAQRCDPKQHKACAAVRVASLEDACHCEVSIDPHQAAQLDPLIAAYRAQGCGSAPALCNRQCLTPSSRCVGASSAPARCGGSP
jgi:hypothetical protein